MDAHNSVVVLRYNDACIVRIREDGVVTDRRFDYEPFARSWADGQRMRMALAEVEVISIGGKPDENGAACSGMSSGADADDVQRPGEKRRKSEDRAI